MPIIHICQYFLHFGFGNVVTINCEENTAGNLKSNHLKSRLLGRILSGPVFRGRALAMANHSKLDHSKSGRICPDFKWFVTKWQQFVRISNGWASRFQIPFEIPTVCNLTSFRPFDIQTTQSGFQIPTVVDVLTFVLCLILQFYFTQTRVFPARLNNKCKFFRQI